MAGCRTPSCPMTTQTTEPSRVTTSGRRGRCSRRKGRHATSGGRLVVVVRPAQARNASLLLLLMSLAPGLPVPALQPEFRAAVMAYFAEVERCSFRLLEAFCEGLGMEQTALHHLFQVRTEEAGGWLRA